MSEERKLSTIVFADIAGYTALMQSDEKTALEILVAFRTVIESSVDISVGRIIQYYGDGALMAFDNSTDAIGFALQIQKQFIRDSSAPVRIGIHSGEVVFREDNVFGDGVNIASRVESLGVPGTVLVSKVVRDQIKNKSEFKLTSIGSFEFKNVEEPMEVFALDMPPLRVPAGHEIKGKVKEPSDAHLPWYRRRRALRLYLSIVVYGVVAWLAVEGFDWWVDKNSFDPEFTNLVIIVLAFGFISLIISRLFRGKLNWKAILIQTLILITMIAAVGYYTYDPNIADPGKLRLVKLHKAEPLPFEALNSIAILPFTNLAGDAEQEYLLAGMQDGLITEMGQLSGIRVIGRTSTLPFANSSVSLTQIARSLNVDAIIEGTLMRVDTVVDLRFKLIDVFPEEKQLWSQSYSTTIDQLPNLYRELTQRVASQLNYVLTAGEETRISNRGNVDAEAYRNFMKAEYYVSLLTAEAFDRAEEYYNRAIDLDPDYASFYSGLAGLWMSRSIKYLVPPDSANPIVKSLLEKARLLDPESYHVNVALGFHRYAADYDWGGSEEAFLKALETNPNGAAAHNGYSHLLMILNRNEESLEQMRYTLAVAPDNPWAISFSGIVYINNGQFISGFKQLDRLYEIAPKNEMANSMRMLKCVMWGQDEAAFHELKIKVGHIGLQSLHPMMNATFEREGWDATLQATVNQLEKMSKERFIAPSFINSLYDPMMLNNKEKFIYWLEKMYEGNDTALGYMGIRSDFLADFQSDPRYIDIMEKIGLW